MPLVLASGTECRLIGPGCDLWVLTNPETKFPFYRETAEAQGSLPTCAQGQSQAGLDLGSRKPGSVAGGREGCSASDSPGWLFSPGLFLFSPALSRAQGLSHPSSVSPSCSPHFLFFALCLILSVSSFQTFWSLFYDLAHVLSWRMFHVTLRRIYTLLLNTLGHQGSAVDFWTTTGFHTWLYLQFSAFVLFLASKDLPYFIARSVIHLKFFMFNPV